MLDFKIHARVIAFGGVAALVVGCSTVDPLGLPVTSRDAESYVSDVPSPPLSAKYKIAVKSIAGEERNDKKHDAFMAKSAETSVSRYFANLGWFKPVSGESGIVLDASGFLDEDKTKLAEDVDMMLLVESRLVCIGWPYWQDRGTVFSENATGVRVTTEFKLINVRTKEPMLVRRYMGKVEAQKGRIRESISAAVDGNARRFAKVVSARFLPPVRVLETRGNGRCALIALGNNYMAEPGKDDQPATRIDFFYKVKAEDAGGAAYDNRTFARGTVISSDKRQAWVEVDNYEEAGVKKGHMARISEQGIPGEAEQAE